MSKMKNKGFTLAELLIVVAIIAILVAISLPLFSSQIAKANLQADQTHVSAAKASAVAEYLDTNSHDTITYYFDAGIAMANKNNSEGIAGYGKSTKERYKNQTGANGVPVSEDGSKNIIQVIVGNNGTVMSTSWVPVGTNSNSQGGGSIQPAPSPSATPAPTQEPTPSVTPNPNVPDWVITNCNGSWPTKINVGTDAETIVPNSITKGNIYRDSNGDYYVASKDQAMDKNNYWKPSDNKGWLAVKIDNTNPVYTVNDLILDNGSQTEKHIAVKQDDIFKYSDTEIYIRQYDNGWAREPHVNGDAWILINTK